MRDCIPLIEQTEDAKAVIPKLINLTGYNQEFKGLLDLPAELILKVLFYLTPKLPAEIVKLQFICQALNQLGNDEHLWKEKYKHDFPEDYLLFSESREGAWRTKYAKQYLLIYLSTFKLERVLFDVAKKYTCQDVDLLNQFLQHPVIKKDKKLVALILSSVNEFDNQALLDICFKLKIQEFIVDKAVAFFKPGDREDLLADWAENCQQGEPINNFLKKISKNFCKQAKHFSPAQKINYILKANLNAVDLKGRTLLHMAARKNCLEIIPFLLGPNIDINNASNILACTPLMMAAVKGNIDAMKLLISHGAKLNAKDSQGNTLLHLVAYVNQTKVIKYLVEQIGMQVNSLNKEGKTPIFLSVEYGNLEAARLLIAKGADVNIKDNANHTPISLIYMGYENSLNIGLIELLLAHGVNINDRNEHGCTLLHRAVENGNSELVQFLLKQKNMNIKLKDNRGLKASDLAKSNNFTEIINIFANYNSVRLSPTGLFTNHTLSIPNGSDRNNEEKNHLCTRHSIV